MDGILEYLVRLRGAGAAAGEMRGLAGEMRGLAAAQTRVGESGAAAAAGTGRLSSVAGIAGKGVAALGVAAVGVGFEAVKMSTQFNHEMLRIRTDAGASTQELANMKRGVLDLASSGASMGQGPMSLAQGLYHLESLGIRGARALHALKLASEETAISGANLEQTTSALGAAMFVGIKGTGNLDQTMGILNATVGAGNMRFQDLVDALGTGILASSKVAGLSIQDVGAALATLSDGGQHASSAAAQLATALHFLYAPSGKAEAALSGIGLSGTRLAIDMRRPQGLLVALRDLHDHMRNLSGVQQSQVLSSILPGGRGRVLLTLFEQLDRLDGKYKQIGHTAAGFAGSVAMQRHDPTTRLKTAEAALQANMIRLGNVLTPIVVPALAAVVHGLSDFVSLLTKIPQGIKDVVHWFEGLGGGAQVVADTFGGGMKRVGTAISSVTTPVGRAMATIGRVATELWHTISSTFSSVARTAHQVFNGSFVNDLKVIGKKLIEFAAVLAKVLGPTLRSMIIGAGSVISGVFKVIGGVVQIIANLLTGHFGKAWDGVKKAIGGVVQIVGGGLRAALSVTLVPLLVVAKGAVQGVSDGITWLWRNVLKPVVDFITANAIPVIRTLGDMFLTIVSPITAVIGGLTGVLGGLTSIGDFVAHTGQHILDFFNSLNPFSSGTNLGVNAPPISTAPVQGIAGAGSAVGSALGAPQPAPTLLPGFVHPSHDTVAVKPVHASLHATIHNNLIVDGQVLARVTRRQIIKAQAQHA